MLRNGPRGAANRPSSQVKVIMRGETITSGSPKTLHNVQMFFSQTSWLLRWGIEPHGLIIHSFSVPLLCKVEQSCSLVFQRAFESQTAYQ